MYGGTMFGGVFGANLPHRLKVTLTSYNKPYGKLTGYTPHLSHTIKKANLRGISSFYLRNTSSRYPYYYTQLLILRSRHDISEREKHGAL